MSVVWRCFVSDDFFTAQRGNKAFEVLNFCLTWVNVNHVVYSTKENILYMYKYEILAWKCNK